MNNKRLNNYFRKVKKKSKFLYLLSIFLVLAFFVLKNISGDVKNLQQNVDINEHGNLVVNYIDVGQGESILIQTPSNKNILIDAGGTKKDAAYNFIKNKNIEKIDIVLATHPHSDHINELPKILKSFEIGEIYMPKVSHTSKTFESLLDTIIEKKINAKEAKAGIQIPVEEDLNLNIIAPNSDSYENLNDWSIVTHLTYGKRSFLFTGDAEHISENEILANNIDITSDVLNVGHHGSNTSSSLEFLEKVNPSYAVISAGKDNSYNHPHTEVIQNLNKIGAEIYITYESGNIIFICDGENIKIELEKS